MVIISRLNKSGGGRGSVVDPVYGFGGGRKMFFGKFELSLLFELLCSSENFAIVLWCDWVAA